MAAKVEKVGGVRDSLVEYVNLKYVIKTDLSNYALKGVLL